MRLFLVIFAAICFLGENVTDNLGINRNIFQMVILLMGFILMANHKTLFSCFCQRRMISSSSHCAVCGLRNTCRNESILDIDEWSNPTSEFLMGMVSGQTKELLLTIVSIDRVLCFRHNKHSFFFFFWTKKSRLQNQTISLE